MAVADLSLDLTISDQCPDYVFTDVTDYLPVKKRFEFKFHDYSGAAPTASTSFTFSQITFATSGLDLLTSSVIVTTDASGDIIDPEDKYNELIQALVDGGSGVTGVLNKNNSTDYKAWHLDISGFISEATVSSEAVNITVTAGITPSVVSGDGVADTVDGGFLIEGRNLNVYDPNGNEIDLGQVAQVDTLTLSRSVYNVGDDIIYEIW